MYFHVTRRLEALYDTWVAFKCYPTVSPVAEADQFESMLRRIGIGGQATKAPG